MIGLFSSVIYQIKSYQSPIAINLYSPLGYTQKYSFTEGEDISFYIHNKNDASLDLYYLGAKKEKIKSFGLLSKNIQSKFFNRKLGFNWKASFLLQTNEFKSGYYLLELKDEKSGNMGQIPFIIKPKKAKRIALIASTNTWDAYNYYGGKSNYKDNQTPILFKTIHNAIYRIQSIVRTYERRPSKRLPKNRPYYVKGIGFDSEIRMEELIIDNDPTSPFTSNKLRSEWVLASFLDIHGIEYGVYSDRDLAFDYSINNAEIIVLNTHSEYWSSQMIGRLQQFIEKGGKVVSLSGNNIYRQIEFKNGYIEVVNQRLNPKKATELIGTFYTDTISEKEMGYKVINPAHWVFKGSGIQLNSVFGKYSANWGRENKGFSHGASADEVDQINEYTKGFETLAIGENKSTPPAYMVFKNTKYGGWIFNASSITFVGALFHDSVINQIVLNLLSPLNPDSVN